MVVDAGARLEARSHTAADDLAIGEGGAGLFSDGKFSFYPSGSQLYRLGDEARLRAAYAWCCGRLTSVGIGHERYPERLDESANDGLKAYPAHYATLAQRRAFIRMLKEDARTTILTHTRVIAIERSGSEYAVTMQHAERGVITEMFSGLILATGRFGGLDILERRVASRVPLTELRYELGVRIESVKSLGFLSRFALPDVKMLWQNQTVEVRTFCTCREGEVWNVPTAALSALSGRSDGPKTEYSNFGLLARFSGRGAAQGERLWHQLRSSALVDRRITFESVKSFMSGDPRALAAYPISADDRPWSPKAAFVSGSIRERIGTELHSILSDALAKLLAWSADLDHPQTAVLFPAIEGVGSYPACDSRLRLPGERIWCCGDVVGHFRGLIPCLVSGYFAGSAVAEELAPES